MSRVPDGWEEKELGDIASSCSGGTPSRTNMNYYSGSIPWVKSGELNNIYIHETKEFLTQDGLNNSSAKWVPAKSVLIAMYGATAGVIGYLQIDATINQAILALIPSDHIESKFLFFFMQIVSKRMLKSVQGSGQPNLNASIINSQRILLPPLPEQKKIAEILTSVDEAIQSTQAVIEQTKKVKQGLMQELLTKGIGHTKFKQVELNGKMVKVPAEWEVKKIAKIAEVNPINKKIKNEKVSFLSMADISVEGRVSNLQIRDYHEVAKGFTTFIKDDILVAKITPCFENGKGALVPKLIGEIGYGSTEFHVLRADKKNSIPTYIYYHTLNEDFRRIGKQNMRGSAGQKRVPTDFIEQYTILLPPLPEQKRITEILTSVDASIQSGQDKLAQVQTLKKGLMQDLLTGKVRVKVQAATQAD